MASETRQWVERFDALRDDLATGDLYHVQKWVQNDGALTEIAEGLARLTAELEEAREREQRMWTVLHSVEWQGREDDDGWRQCPECWAWGSEGHTPDCALRAILATPPAEGGGDAD